MVCVTDYIKQMSSFESWGCVCKRTVDAVVSTAGNKKKWPEAWKIQQANLMKFLLLDWIAALHHLKVHTYVCACVNADQGWTCILFIYLKGNSRDYLHTFFERQQITVNSQFYFQSNCIVLICSWQLVPNIITWSYGMWLKLLCLKATMKLLFIYFEEIWWENMIMTTMNKDSYC